MWVYLFNMGAGKADAKNRGEDFCEEFFLHEKFLRRNRNYKFTFKNITHFFNMHLLIGLGNFGREYEATRHNFGFMLLDQIVEDYGLVAQSKKFKSEVFSGEIDGKKVVAIKPQTYMNLSGEAALAAASFYKIAPKNILVFHDDFDLELARIKVKIGGGHAGHNGLKSIDGAIGKDYMRLRLGIGRPENSEFETADYVLGKFTRDEINLIKKTNEKISDLIGELLEGRADGFLNKFYL